MCVHVHLNAILLAISGIKTESILLEIRTDTHLMLLLWWVPHSLCCSQDLKTCLTFTVNSSCCWLIVLSCLQFECKAYMFAAVWCRGLQDSWTGLSVKRLSVLFESQSFLKMFPPSHFLIFLFILKLKKCGMLWFNAKVSEPSGLLRPREAPGNAERDRMEPRLSACDMWDRDRAARRSICGLRNIPWFELARGAAETVSARSSGVWTHGGEAQQVNLVYHAGPGVQNRESQREKKEWK